MSAAMPIQDRYAVPTPSDPAHISRGYGELSQGNVATSDFAGNPAMTSPLAQSVQQAQAARFHEDFDASQRGSSIIDGIPDGFDGGGLHRTDSQLSYLPSRSGTLKKKAALTKKNSLRRTSSRRSSHAGSVRSLALGERERYADGDGEERNSAFYTPVPTSGNPTEILAHRFQGWRKVLKDLTIYFREVQVSHESRSKSLLKLSNVINNTTFPTVFLAEGGISDANHILSDFHKQAFAEANRAKEIETGVISQLTGLRNDLGLKIKEIKNLSGDFKNSVDKEMEVTKKTVAAFQEALGIMDNDPSQVAGKGDPFIVKLAVERQIEKQINEENYLHTALLNLESSGRELESIVVGEIQKAYEAYTRILKRDAEEVNETVQKLRSGPLSIPKDYEWNRFVENDDHFIDPRLPVRKAEDIEYPGRNHPAASEVRAGMLERKSKYLKSYTPGWYVLSPSHLHEFKSHERLNEQSPVMSLFLPEQKLGSHSQPGSSSHKFMIKGRQTGGMHSRHSWVFRAESHDTMLAWYEDIQKLTEISTGAERNEFVVRHRRTISSGSHKAASVSSDGGLDEDEADQVPYSATASSVAHGIKESSPQRPQPGGRFPSQLQVDRSLQAPLSASSGDSIREYDAKAPVGTSLGTGIHYSGEYEEYFPQGGYASGNRTAETYQYGPSTGSEETYQKHNSVYGDWMSHSRHPSGAAPIATAESEAGASRNYQPAPLEELRPHPQQKLDSQIVPQQVQQQEQQEASSFNVHPQGAPVLVAAVIPEMSRSESFVGVKKSAEVASDQTQASSGSTVPATVDHVDDLSTSTAFSGPRPPASCSHDESNGARVKGGTPMPSDLPRHKSVTSVSDLHVPGEYPPTPSAS